MTETLIEERPAAEEELDELTNAALTLELLSDGSDGALVEEPLDSGLWPAVELSDGAVRAFVEAVHAIQRREEQQRREAAA